MSESWALPALQWLISPALVIAAILALARLYDPPTRWSRRLKSDLSILGGLPEGPEKRIWQISVEWQAQRLREYRRAFVGTTLLGKWIVLAFSASTILGLIIYPPVNEPGEPLSFGPADYWAVVMGLGATAAYVVSVGSGRDFVGRTPYELLLARRLRRRKRRERRLRRLDKVRARSDETGSTNSLNGSRLGFSTQVDEFGPWMRDFDLRGYAYFAGYLAGDIRARYYADIRKRGLSLPYLGVPRRDPSETLKDS